MRRSSATTGRFATSEAAATSKSLPLGASSEEGNTTAMAAPLYITIGPPCSGKTTWLKEQAAQSSVVDISLDDQPNVYVPIPAELFAASADTVLEKKGLSSKNQKLLQTSIFQKTVQERLLFRDTQEMRLIWQRVSGTITKDELEASLRISQKERVQDGRNNHNRQQQQHRNRQKTAASESNGDNNIVMTTLLESVERAVGQRQETPSVSSLPGTVDLFVVEALFQKKPGNVTGIERATNLLKQTSNTTSVAWGNTNTKPTDYSQALEIAQRQGRPVHFCIFDSGSHCHDDNDNNGNSCDETKKSIFDLSHVSYSQLMDRNIQRLVKSGRYVPSKAIWDASSRVETLISDVIGQVRHSKTKVVASNSTAATTTSVTKLELDRQLARLAGFDLKDNRTVSKVSGGGNPRYNNIGRNNNKGNGWPSQQQRHPTWRSFDGPSKRNDGHPGNDSSNRNNKRTREDSSNTANQKATSKPRNKLLDS